MSSTLSEGVRVPDIGSVNWGADVNFNWGLLNTCLANISGNVKTDVANTWTATQTFTETISGSIDGVAARAVGDEDGNNIKTSLASKAADNAVVHLAGAETITGDKTFTGATATHHITPETDGTYSLGSSSYQWGSVYAQTYYYNGVAWGLDKSNVWTGLNTFSSASNCVFSFKFGSSGSYCDIRYYDSNDVQYATLRSKVNELVLGLKYSSASVWYNGASVTINNTGTVQIKSYDGTETWTVNFTPVGVYPTSNNALELGTSSNKWKTLNGINPGALSLHNFNAAITLDTTNWDKTGEYGANANFWTPTVNGWLTVLIIGTPGAGWVQLSQADSLGQFSICLSTGYAWATIPVVANWQCKIALLCSTVASAKFYPCLGNV